MIEEVYSARFTEEQNTFRKSMGESNGKEETKDSKVSFSKFVANYIEDKWKSVRLSSQVLLTLTLGCL